MEIIFKINIEFINIEKKIRLNLYNANSEKFKTLENYISS